MTMTALKKVTGGPQLPGAGTTCTRQNMPTSNRVTLTLDQSGLHPL
jgi:hypothetical protein